MAAAKHPLFHPPIVRRAVRETVYKLSPRHMLRNPVMFVVLVGSVLTSLVDVAKYFAIIPAMFAATYPEPGALNIMHLASPRSAILSSVIFNALVIVALIPLALRGVTYRPAPAGVILRRNLLVYGLGGLPVPFADIKLVDVVLSAMGLV